MHSVPFAALGDATRCQLVEMLKPGPLPVHTLTAAFSISRPAISRHLKVLKDAGLVIEEKQGRENLYRLLADQLDPLRLWLANFQAPVGRPASSTKKPATSPTQPKPKSLKPRQPRAPKPSVITTEQIAVHNPPAKTVEIARKPKPTPPQNQMAWEF